MKNYHKTHRLKDKHGHLTYNGKKTLVSMRLHGKMKVKDICTKLDISKKAYYYWWNRYDQFGMNGLKGPVVQSIKPKKTEISYAKKRYIVNERKKGRSYGDIAKDLKISRSTVVFWWKRYKENGLDGLDRKSRLPNTIERTHPDVIEEVLKNRDKYKWGPHKISATLAKWKKILLSHGTIYAILVANDKIIPTKRRGVQRNYLRWQRHHPNSLWQIDLHVIKNGPDAGKILITVLDDCTRKVVLKYIQSGYSIQEFLELLEMLFEYLKPKQILTDNGSQFVAVLNKDKNDRTEFQKLLLKFGIQHIRARIKHPQTLGKIERFHRSFEEEIGRFENIDDYIYFYNYLRPHQSLDYRTPAEDYEFNYIAELLFVQEEEKIEGACE